MTLTTDDMDVYERLGQAEAREHFWAYRRYLRPDMLLGWWQETVADEFEAFYQRLVRGQRPKLLLVAPPQHGKSEMVTDFIGYVAGRQPDLKAIFTSYSDDLGLRCNAQLQRTYDGARFKAVFPHTVIGAVGHHGLSRAARNNYLLEYVGKKGNFSNTTVNGQITGKGLDLGVIDDPIKGREAAHSKAIRDKAWGWLTDDFFTRFSDGAGLIITTTRWHLDDPAGRWLEKFPGTRVLHWPAIAVRDEPHRLRGEPLFPELKSLAFLEERRKLLIQASWEALYQGSPIKEGGGMFKTDRIDIADRRPALVDIKRSVRYWDKAGTAGGGAFTCGVRMDLLKNGRIVISDVRRGQWSALEREDWIKKTCASDHGDGHRVHTWVEQEPGSGGKESAERTIAMLKGYVCRADRVTGSKEIRAEPFASQVEGRNVQMVAADWNADLLDEMSAFPSGKRKDQVDAAGGAFTKLTERGGYDTSFSWVG